jgi:hypothetical protein
MADPIWPGTKSKVFARVVEQAKLFYGRDFTHENFVDLNEKIRSRTVGTNYHEVHNFFSPEHRSFYAIWQEGTWVACKRNQTHVCDLLPPAVLDEFRETKLHYREPHVLPYLRVCKANCVERFQWDGFNLAEWVQFSERIRNWDTQPGVLKVESRGDVELWAVNKKGLYWFACLWDPKIKAIVEIEKSDVLYETGILTGQDE